MLRYWVGVVTLYVFIPCDPSGRDQQFVTVGAEGATYSGISQAKGPLGEGPLESR